MRNCWPLMLRYCEVGMASFNENIGKKIVLARQSAEISQHELAKRLSISQQVLSGYERGRTSVPLKTFVDICTSLNAPLSWFLPSVKQYGDIVGSDEIELLRELRKLADTTTLLEFVKHCLSKQSHGKTRRILPKKVSVR